MAEQASWTLDELVGRVATVLATPAYPGAPNGRVRDLPDRRAVRWYVTTGLVDRPLMQGRCARYRSRHLLQIVAIKRLQAQGHSLAAIQAELAGATDDTLRRIAAAPDDVVAAGPGGELPAAARPNRNRFWAEPPAATVEPAANDEAEKMDATDPDTVMTLAAVRLPGGALLLLPTAPDGDDLDAIHAAAGPLLKLLADRSLLPLDERSQS